MQAQKLKSEKTQLYQMCSALGTKLRYGLTGTPMQNRHKELYNLLRLCALAVSLSVSALLWHHPLLEESAYPCGALQAAAPARTLLRFPFCESLAVTWTI